MKINRIFLFFMVLLILSLGVVYAEDSNQTAQDNLEITDNDVLLVDEKTYTDFEDNINKSKDTITLNDNYKYDYETDGIKINLKISNKNLTIEGNGNYIDGDKKAGFLRITNSNIIIKNLIIKNCNYSSIVASDSLLSLINVTFEDNSDGSEGSALYLSDSNVTSKDCVYLNNYAPWGSSIYALSSEIKIENGLFKNDNPVEWGLIYGSDAYININNTTFANTTSKYATAIYNTFKTVIKKSKFINLHANITAGAIAIKGMVNTTTSVIDCEFVNVSSAKNGGALFLDIYGNSDGKLTGDVLINNTVFNNCSSEFGGCILQLGGTANILNSQFINNKARENGGVIYTSYVKLSINNANFTNNNAELGGAIFFDKAILTISKSNFKNNDASEGKAIYIYDSKYSITDSQFAENGEDIRSYFDKEGCIISNCGDVNSTLNASFTEFMIRYGGLEYEIKPTIIDVSASAPSFDLRNWNLVTPVKNQGSMGSCWAFGAAGAFESAFLKATGIILDISENNIQNMGLCYSIYGNSEFSESGTYYTSTAYFMSWMGAINTTDDVYDELGKISSLSFSPNAYHIVDAVFVDINNRNAVKEALIKYGALNLFVYGANSRDSSYNEEYKSVYNTNQSGNHYVTLVGWNDTFSKDHFTITAPGDGAWICKNSWGTDWGDEGYFYLSYYDFSLIDSDVVGFVIENNESYEKLYQIEVGGMDNFDKDFNEYEDVFVSDGGDIIAAVGSYFEKANTPYTISIYVDDNLIYTQNGIVSRAGYNTIKLDQYIGVEDKSVFSIRIKSSSTPLLSQTRQQLFTNNSYVVENGKILYLSDAVAPIKVYAYHNNLITKNIIKCNDGKEVIFSVEEADDNVIIGFNGINQTVDIVDRKGNVSLGILNVGEYEVTVYYKNQTYKNYIIIKKSIDFGTQTSYVISYNSEITLIGELLDFNAKPLNNTKITVKFDDEVIGIDTDAKGYLRIRVYEGNSIGKHNLEITNPITGEKVIITITIVSRFTANTNVNMYYFDGHAYKVRVRDDWGNFAGKNEIVTIKIGSKTFKVKTDAQGYAILKIPKTVTPGSYKIYATYCGQTVKNTLKVKQVLKLTKVNVKKSAKKLVIKATLKNGKKALKNKKLTFKFKGKKYTAKTNKKGVAKITIKKSVLKKLKVGKKVTYQVTYLKDTVKRTVKIKK